MIRILKYIFSNNSFFGAIKHLFLAVVYQVTKRVTGATISKKIFNGKEIYLFPNCNVSTTFVYTDVPDKKEIFALRSLAQKGDVFLDIGANIGSYSVSMMDVCNTVIAFEPHPFTARRCRMNFLLNGMPADNVKQVALSNKTGFTLFSDNGGSSTTNSISTDGSGIDVPVNTLDAYATEQSFEKDRGYLLKIDVEGFEKEVLEGAPVFLGTYNIKGIVLECFKSDEVFPILRSYGFTVFERFSENNFFIKK